MNILFPAKGIPLEIPLEKKEDSINVVRMAINKDGHPVKDALIVFENGPKHITYRQCKCKTVLMFTVRRQTK